MKQIASKLKLVKPGTDRKIPQSGMDTVLRVKIFKIHTVKKDAKLDAGIHPVP